jgi:hypothetical protein
MHECLTPLSSYPLVYCIIGLPLSAARWSQFARHHVPSTATLVTSFIYDLTGLCNVLLFVWTRRGLLLISRGPGDNPTPVSGSGING